MKILNAIKEKVKDCDGLGEEFKITQEKRHQYSTVYGGILSIIAYIIAFLIISNFIRKYFVTTDPNISETFQFATTIPKVDTY